MNQRLKSTYYDRHAEHSKSQNRKYLSKGTSPDGSNQQTTKLSYDMFQATSPLTNPLNTRYHIPIHPHRSGYIQSKNHPNNPLSFYQLDSQLIISNNTLANKRKRGMSGYKKMDILTPTDNKVFMSRKITKQISQASKPSKSQQTNQIRQIDVQQIHYKMVEQQQMCKQIIIN